MEDGFVSSPYLGKYPLSYPGPVRSASDIHHRILFTVRAHYEADNREWTWWPTKKKRGEEKVWGRVSLLSKEIIGDIYFHSHSSSKIKALAKGIEKKKKKLGCIS